MEFLLQSQKRHKKWILLKQLLLLLLRMAAIAAMVLMLAQPVLRSEWGAMFGGSTTHHFVLLDDSYSMTDHDGQATAFDRAKWVVQRIAERASAEGGSQRFSLLRFSEAAELTVGSQPDIFHETIDDALTQRIETFLAQCSASESDPGPLEVLEAQARLPQKSDGETLVVYLVSDFREREWLRANELRRHLLQLQEQGAQWHFVNCTNETHPNLAITQLRPQTGLHAAGVEMWMELVVANYGEKKARGITIQLLEDGHPRGALELEPIPARGELAHRFRINFPGAGPHAIEVILPPDAVAVDNHRFYAADVPSEIPLLLMDGTTTGEDSRFISTSLAPGGSVKTGWQPRIEPPSSLRQADQLAQYAAVFLLDIPRLDGPEIETLEAYAHAGGGVAFFLGDRTNRDQVNNQWYRLGAGLFPVPLHLPTQLLALQNENSPDIRVIDHPVFRIFSGSRNSFLKLMLVDFYYAIDQDWLASEERVPLAPNGRVVSTQVIARLRNGAPLVVEKPYGKGRVIAFLTKASPEQTSHGSWNNWGNNPAFPVVMNELAGYLAAHWRDEPIRIVGEPIDIVLDESEYVPDLKLILPAADSSEVLPLDAAPAENALHARLPFTRRSGIYTVELNRLDDRQETRQFAMNVPNGEGDLARVAPSQMEPRLLGVRYSYHLATEFTEQLPELAGFHVSDAILYLLIALLLVEQLLAYLFSYHPQTMKMPSHSLP